MYEEAQAGEATTATSTLKVAITKAKASLSVDVNALPANVFTEVIAQGLKAMLNSGMTKVVLKGLEGAELEKAQAAALEIATAKLSAMMAGRVTTRATKSDTKVSGAVMTEAMRLARNIVKDSLKRDGKKVSHYAAKDITTAAKALIAANPELVKEAEDSLTKRQALKVEINLGGIQEDATLVAAAEAKKAKDKANKPLSAAQAGKTAKRSKPVQPSA